MTAICEHFDLMVQAIQANIERNRRGTDEHQTMETHIKIGTEIREAIQIHLQIYEWVESWNWFGSYAMNIPFHSNSFDLFTRTVYYSIFERAAEISSVPIFALLSSSPVILGIALYQIHQVNVLNQMTA